MNQSKRHRWTVILIPVSSAALVGLAFYSENWTWTIWFALVPLLLGCRSASPFRALAYGLVYGVISLQLICSWIYHAPGFHWYHAVPLLLYAAIYPAVWCMLVAALIARGASVVVPGSALWVLGDYIKLHAGFLSLPWATLAQSQHAQLSLLQFGQYGGEYGITLLIIATNLALFEIIALQRYRRALAVVTLTMVISAIGAYQMERSTSKGARVLSITAIQPSLLIEDRLNPAVEEASLQRVVELVNGNVHSAGALLFLPETVLRDDATGRRYLAKLAETARRSRVDLVFGMSDQVKFVVKANAESLKEGYDRKFYNAAYHLSAAGGLSAPYRKNILVPFGEFNPFTGALKLPAWFLPDAQSISQGEKYRLFETSSGALVAPVICWEIMFTDFLMERLAGRKPDLIANLTNDNWFGISAAARQQNAVGVFRAIEYRVPVVICSNTGPSQIIDPFGRIITRSSRMFEPDTIHAEVIAGADLPDTVYSRLGGLAVFGCVAILGLLCLAVSRVR